MSETRSGGGRGKNNSMVQSRTVALKVFRMSMVTILRLEDSDRGDDAQTTVKFFFLGRCSPYSVLDSG